MNNHPFLMFDDLVKQYSKRTQIGEINFSIQEGEIFALCGGNGAGKSTLIKMLTGIIKPSSGNIRLHGKVVNPLENDFKMLFSYMPDVMLLPEQLTAREVLRFFGQLRRVSNERVEKVLELTGLSEVGDQLINHYSKGMQQRLSLAQALLPDVKLLILDEPTNGLDPFWVYRLKEILLEEQRAGTTIIFTTHILSFVEELANRVAFLEKGKVIECDYVEKLVLQNNVRIPLEKVFLERQLQ